MAYAIQARNEIRRALEGEISRGLYDRKAGDADRYTPDARQSIRLL